MKLNRLRSVVNQCVRSSAGRDGKYLQDPFYHYTPEIQIEVDLITGNLIPDMEGDDVENYYKGISEWFHNVLRKEGIPLDVIDKAIIKISPKEKECIIQAQGRVFKASVSFKKS
ncbi:MAG: hypothetical protein ACFFAH_16370 [Promethearchaeota archaeon]